MHPLGQKAIALAFLTFLILWVAGLFRVSSLPASPTAWPVMNHEELGLNSQRMQAANNLKQLGLGMTPLPLVLDKLDVDPIRIHEKSAQLTTRTAAFEDDEGRIRAALNGHEAVILNERSSGLVGQRRLTLVIGVQLHRFDDLVEQLSGIARLDSISVQQRDRTDEFRRLHAQRQSAKKYLESVQKLRKAKTPSIEDELRVEQKIQEIEKELQTLAVQLGDLLGKESYYHISLTLVESHSGSWLDRADGLPRHMGRAFLWALPWWGAVLALLSVFPGAYFSIRALVARP
jgi:Domain of unknown function (DUF4349)